MTQQKQISDTTLALLAYWRAALADSCLFHPAILKDCEQIQIGQNANGMWRVTETPEGWIESTFSASKMNKADDGDVRKPIPLLLIPSLLAPVSMHGIKRGAAESEDSLVPLCIPCMLTPEGALLADTEHLPWIPRKLLEPSLSDATVGTLADLDYYLTQFTGKRESVSDTMRVAQELFAHVTGCRLAQLSSDLDEKAVTPPLLGLEDYGVIDGWFGVPYEPTPPALHIIRLYDLLAEGQVATPLLESLTHMPDRRAQSPLSLAQSAPRFKKIVGHINRRHPLSPSQHEAMVEMLGLKDGEVLAVNGPPGTGKTTLLQSVVAQEWVTAAIDDQLCPIIAATSTNVKAVENVLDSFAKLGNENAHERWLPDIGGFGLFLASASRDSEHPVYNGPKEHYFIQFETPDWVNRAKTYYLERAKGHSDLDGKTATVDNVIAELRKLLRRYHKDLQEVVAQRYRIFTATGADETVGALTGMKRVISDYQQQIKTTEQKIAQAEHIIEDCKAQKMTEQAQHERNLQEIKNAELAWNAYLASSPFWLDLFAFIPAVKRRRNARDRTFLMSNPLTDSLQHRDDGIEDHFARLVRHEKLRTRAVLADIQKTEDAAAKQRNEARTQKVQITAQLHEIESFMRDWLVLLGDALTEFADVSLRDLNDKLDTKIRAPMFQFADWYWSGCWLIEMETRFREGGQDTKAPAKLEAMLRRFAKLTPCMVSNFHMAPSYFCGWMGKDRPIPLWNVIDLLIVDEAGQVSPEVGAPTFALAKRAIVVGDVYQIEPIWNVPESIDRANAAKFGLIEKYDDPRYLKMEQDGYTSAKGNLMQIGARACRLQKYPDIRGLLLTEHRRCVPELIDYCNKLVYGGRLDSVRKSIPPEQKILPAFGYFAITSRDQKVGGSRKNAIEARAIVDWIVQNRTRLENHYLDPRTSQPQHIGKIIAIVTPFNPQANLIAGLIKKRMPDTKKKGCLVTVGTVHRLQGAERQIVIFSPVYGEDHKRGMFFDDGRNMMNVAVSRAKDSFLVFGNMTIFNPQKSGSPSGLLAKYLFEHKENDLTSATPVCDLAASTLI